MVETLLRRIRRCWCTSSPPSQEVLSTSPRLTINFDAPVQAFGIDLRSFNGLPALATMTVYAANQTQILVSQPFIALSGVPIFAGWADANGIGRVTLVGTSRSWSPIVDNVEFGLIPEPGTALLVACGLALVAAPRRIGSLERAS